MTFTSHYSKKITAIVLFVAIIVSMPVQAHFGHSVNISIGSSDQQQNENKKPKQSKAVARLMRAIKNQQTADYVLNSMPNRYQDLPMVITQNENNELQLERLISVLGRPQTSFGFTGLKWLLVPVTDLNEIRRRQTIVRSLVQDEKLYNELKKALHKVQKGEGALLNYWKDKFKLHEDAQSVFNYKFPKSFNKSSVALEGGAWLELGQAAASLFKLHILTVIEQSMLTVFIDPELSATSLGKNIADAWRGTFRFLDPRQHIFNDARADLSATDLAIQLQAGMRISDDQTKGSIQKQNRSAHNLRGEERMHVLGAGSLGDKFKYIKDCLTNQDYRSAFGGSIFSGLIMAAHGYFLYDGIKRSWNWLKHVTGTSQNIHKSLVDIAGLIRSIEEVEQVVSQAQVLRSCKVQRYFQKVTNKRKRSKKMKELIDLLKSSTFDKSGTILHRRGRVLRVHNLLKEIKEELIPVLQAIAEFDAYLSLATLVKEKQGQSNHFTFATFATQQEPMIDIDNCWIDGKMIASDQVISNSIKFGVNNNATKAVVTGPNGGGKSTFLKSLGQAVCMAQGWGIVAAQKAHMTLFTGLRTSLDPKEDMSRGISTFMAQKERIKLIENFMAEKAAEDKYLIMLDEPYRGTTDDESADRIWQFGQRIAQMPHCVTLIATHVKKPINLVKDTKGVFANYQVEIDEMAEGQFKRTFRIKPGAAMWWFENAGRRSRFVDWLDDEIKLQAQRHLVAA